MPITQLNTFEGVPLGKENFEEYTSYLSSLTARSNPFIQTAETDFNESITLGANQSVVGATDQVGTYSGTSLNNNATPNLFAYQFPDTSFPLETTTSTSVTTTSTVPISTASMSGTPETYIVSVYVSNTNAAGSNPQYGTFSIQETASSSDISLVYNIAASDISEAQHFYIPIVADNVDSIELDYVNGGGSDGFNFDIYLYKVIPWQAGSTYILNYNTTIPIVTSSVSSTTLNIYYEDLLLASSDLSSSNPIQSIPVRVNESTLGSIAFTPDVTDASKGLIFRLANDNSNYDLDITVSSVGTAGTNLTTLTGTTQNSFAFIQNDENELFALPTYYIENGGYASPPIESWQVPLGSVSELYFGPGDIEYGLTSDKLPPTYNRLTSNDYSFVKTDTTAGSYGKGLILSTLNGIPQVEDDQISFDTFYDATDIVSSDSFVLRSLRLGSEYPTPRYTLEDNHQYARETIVGFSEIDADKTSSESSLGHPYYNNTLSFPFTDFLVNPVLILIRELSDGSREYYYVPQDTDFSSSGSVRKNHYKVIDFSSGEVKFNFDMNFTESPTDAYWIVSAEQLSESTANNVTDYFSSYGDLYSPTANLNVSTTLLAFDPSQLLTTNFESTLPEIPVVALNKVLSSGGGPLISDPEGEFSDFSIYAISYPGEINADSFLTSQANKYEPDVFTLYYYSGVTGDYFTPSSTPSSMYVQIVDNDISWYNRGINSLTYDPVSRAVRSEINLIGPSASRPNNSALLSEIKRRSNLSGAVGIVQPEDTTFIKTLNANAFVYSDASNSIQTTSTASEGSLLVRSASAFDILAKGATGQVLTAGASIPEWQNISTAAWTTLNGIGETGTTSVTATDGGILSVYGATDQIIAIASDRGGVDRGLFLSFPSEVSIENLTVTSSTNLPNSGVVSGTYGSSSSVPSITVNQDGFITAASDYAINTNSWTTITDGSNNASAGITDTLTFTPVAGETEITVSSAPDTVTIGLPNNVTVSNRLTAEYARLNHQSTFAGSANGDLWTTSSDVSIVIDGVPRRFLFADQVGDAGEITTGVLAYQRGGTGYDSYSQGDILVGTSTGGLGRATLTVGSTLNKTVDAGGNTTITTLSTSTNTANRLVVRDGSGNFAAGTITATLSGNASTATALQTARNINGVSFNGTSNITINANTPNSLSTGTGLSGASFNGGSARTFTIDDTVVMTLAGTQTITGAKTFSNAATLVLPVKS